MYFRQARPQRYRCDLAGLTYDDAPEKDTLPLKYLILCNTAHKMVGRMRLRAHQYCLTGAPRYFSPPLWRTFREGIENELGLG